MQTELYIVFSLSVDVLIYLLTAIGLTPSGSSTVHTNNTQNDQKKINRTTKKLIETVRAVPRVGELYPGI
jgi:hypothetical protein